MTDPFVEAAASAIAVIAAVALVYGLQQLWRHVARRAADRVGRTHHRRGAKPPTATPCAVGGSPRVLR